MGTAEGATAPARIGRGPLGGRGRKAGIAVALLLAAGAAIAGIDAAGGGGTDERSSAVGDAIAVDASGASGAAAAATMVGEAPVAAADGALVEAPGGDAGGIAGRLALGQRIAQTISLRVRIEPGGVDAAVARATALATAAGGYVVSASTVSRTADMPGRASLTLRIPAARVGATLDRLGGIGAVEGREITSEDLTQDYVDTGARLRHAQRVEASLTALLDRAVDVDDVLAIQARLDGVQEQIEIAKGRLDGLRAITDDATVTLDLVEPGADGSALAEDDDGLGIAAAAGRGARLALAVVNGAIVAALAALPVLALGGLALVAWRLRRRRRVEAAA